VKQEEKRYIGTGSTYASVIADLHADVEPEDLDPREYGAEGDDDYGDDYGEEGEEGEEGGEEEYGDYGEEEEPEVFPPVNPVPVSRQSADRFFLGDGTSSTEYTDNELDAFFRLL